MIQNPNHRSLPPPFIVVTRDLRETTPVHPPNSTDVQSNTSQTNTPVSLRVTIISAGLSFIPSYSIIKQQRG
ncbi:hypothetical protein JAAARDRAFT_450398 [Jaapia argillacea MUCL 33604]|uniref:Uncharacterized protein n=1 Tax=Jaapia argillacea MUCL 33604 TaxID=933084 RepID=A0A067Q7H8_9AGAM|nr:hypothetical protein JAAARDRAFT_450398 [Jaapia argillacea MUCL 33604]